MIVTCPSCARRYRLDPTRLGGKASFTVRCPGCGATSTVAVAQPEEAAVQPAAAPPAGAAPTTTTTPSGEAPRAGDQTSRLAADAALLAEPAEVSAGEPVLPEGVRITLAVLEGNDSGKMFRIEHPSVVIGRGEGDIRLDDAEVSRRHARLTVHGTRVVLHDLGSTNGTFLDERKISEAAIENRAEFRVGATRMMLILSDEGGGLQGETG
jgi:predicted Zn finger-like uncharacterized protein